MTKPAPSGSSSSQYHVCSPISQAVPLTSASISRPAVALQPRHDARLEDAARRAFDRHRAIAVDEADRVEDGGDRGRALAGRRPIDPPRLADRDDVDVGLAVRRPRDEQFLERRR